MNIIIVRSSPHQSIEALGPSQPRLCEKYPFLLDGDTEKVIEPVFRFIFSRLGFGYNTSLESGKAWCDDLRDWLYFLDSINVEWDQVTELHIESFITQSAGMISPKTGKIYSVRSIERKATTVVSFYKFATNAKILQTTIDFRWKEQTDRQSPSSSVVRGSRSGLIPSKKSCSPLPNIVLPEDYVLLSQTLGLSPSEWEDSSLDSSRDRLIADIAVSTGMRIDEVLSLTVFQMTELLTSGLNDLDFIPLYLTKTKGSKPRFVRLPVWLHKFVMIYINGERQKCFQRMRTLRDPVSLFLPRLNAKNIGTTGIGYRTINDLFSKACVKCGFIKTVKPSKPEAGVSQRAVIPLYSHHDLRHTYACNFYFQAKANGDPEPWKILSVLLGHANIDVTINTYLTVVTAIEGSSAQRKLYEHLQRKLARQP
ncbi:tyrosine-type recombinase/integrase [Pseudomonas costantinii]|uniref:tyrosine-type recombinase/integrase n=1 Tax=Pseudomonas costantinii TaxID=168469 RepID=UPI0015A108B9|nr:site-specific integrase [Pseudomonas costantinii]NVZ69079.1 site-specific integrase [Pseudomonas costantinii]